MAISSYEKHLGNLVNEGKLSTTSERWGNIAPYVQDRIMGYVDSLKPKQTTSKTVGAGTVTTGSGQQKSAPIVEVNLGSMDQGPYRGEIAPAPQASTGKSGSAASNAVGRAQTGDEARLEMLTFAYDEALGQFRQEGAKLTGQVKESLKSGVESFNEKIAKASKEFEDAFKQLTEQQQQMFGEALATFEVATGGLPDLNDPNLQAALQNAAKQGDNQLDAVYAYLDQQGKQANGSGKARPVVYNQRANFTYEGTDLDALVEEARMVGVTEDRIQRALQYQDEGDGKSYLDAEIGLKTGEIVIPTASSPNAAIQNQQTPTEVSQYGQEDYMNDGGVLEPRDQLNNDLDAVINKNPSDIVSQFATMDLANMSSVDLLKRLTISQLQETSILYSEQQSMYEAMGKAATDGRDKALAEIDRGIKEVGQAVDGDDFVPTTYEGLAAKVVAEQKEFSMDSIEAEQELMDAQFNSKMQVEREKRSRLEGYLKAKLVAFGALDSSAGLTVMSVQVNAADSRLELMEAEHRYAKTQLNIQSRQVMSSFTNNILQIGMDSEAKKDSIKENYDAQISEINQAKITSASEKRQASLSILADFQEKSYQIERDRKEDEYRELQMAQQQMKDAIDYSMKLANVTGEIHYVDETGAVVQLLDANGSPIPTFEKQQWQETNMLNYAKFEHNMQNDIYNRALELFDIGGAANIETIRNLTGIDLSGAVSREDAEFALDQAKFAAEQGSTFAGALVTENGPIASLFPDGSHGGQCGAFVRNLVSDWPYGLNTLEQKMGAINSRTPQVGAVLIQKGDPKYGHAAVVNAIEADGTLVLTESNYNYGEKVTNTRRISPDDPSIMGYYVGKLDSRIQSLADSTMNFSSKAAYNNVVDILGWDLGSVSAGENFREAMNRALSSGNNEQAQQLVVGAVKSTLGAEQGKIYGSFITGETLLEDIRGQIVEYERKGGDLNLLSGSLEKVARKLGKTTDPDLVMLATNISASIQAYRKAISGAAFTESEAKEYEDIFPSIKEGTDVSLAKIDALQDSFQLQKRAYIETSIGSQNYEAIFENKDFLKSENINTTPGTGIPAVASVLGKTFGINLDPLTAIFSTGGFPQKEVQTFESVWDATR